MAVRSITATTSSSRLCNYVLNGAAHDGSGDRRHVFASGIGCFAPIAAQAFAITRSVRSQQSIMRQAYSGRTWLPTRTGPNTGPARTS